MCLASFRSLGGLWVFGVLGGLGDLVGLCRSYSAPEYGHRVAHECQTMSLNPKH